MIISHEVESQEYPTSISRLNGKDVENVRTFLYLGCNIKLNEAGVGDSEIEFRIECAERKFYELGKKFINHKIAIRTRVKIFNSLVRGRLMYACQIWSLTRQQLQRITSAYMSMLRKMVKGSYRCKKRRMELHPIKRRPTPYLQDRMHRSIHLGTTKTVFATHDSRRK